MTPAGVIPDGTVDVGTRRVECYEVARNLRLRVPWNATAHCKPAEQSMQDECPIPSFFLLKKQLRSST